MTLTPPFTGGCHCGAVRYEVTADPVMSVVCHCTDCQRLTGATAASLVVVARQALRSHGEVKFYEKTGDSGRPSRIGFCPTCGTAVLGMADIAPELATVAALSLDEPDRFAPAANIYTKSARHWDIMDPDLPAFEELPPMPGEEG